MSPAFLLSVGLILAFGAIGMPVGLAMIVSGIGYLFLAGLDVGTASEQILNSLFSSFVLLAVPLFIFAANVMNAGAISDRLLDFCLSVVGRFRGGLAHVNVLTSLVFSGMSGSALADAAGIGKLLIDMMRRNNRYSPGFAAAITAASATIGPIIPPSIPMVLYGLVSNTSVGYLFLGGILPGLIMSGALMIAIAFIARRRNFPVEASVPFRDVPKITVRAFPALLLPVILLVGIYGGITTATEAASVAAAYALLLAAVVYHTLKADHLVQVLVDSAKGAAVVGLIICGAFMFNYIVAIERIPNLLAMWLDTLEVHPLLFLLVVNILFLLFGCLLDATTMMLILVPLLMPAIHKLGIDPVHFGVVITVNMMIGLITPPYGVLLFLISGLTDIPIREMIREIGWFLAILFLSLFLMVVFPDVVLWIPRLFGYGGG